MTEDNIFKEVQEDLERQRLEALWKKYGFWVILAAVGIVVSTAASTAYRSWKTDRAQAMTQELFAAGRPAKDGIADIQALETVAQKYAKQSHGALALLQAGTAAVENNDTAKAIALFDALANDASADQAYRQLATLLSAQVQLDTGDAASLVTKLEPLAREGAPWRYSAMETMGYAAIRAGDKDKAKQIFTDLSGIIDVPESIAFRAIDILRLFD